MSDDTASGDGPAGPSSSSNDAAVPPTANIDSMTFTASTETGEEMNPTGAGEASKGEGNETPSGSVAPLSAPSSGRISAVTVESSELEPNEPAPNTLLYREEGLRPNLETLRDTTFDPPASSVSDSGQNTTPGRSPRTPADSQQQITLEPDALTKGPPQNDDGQDAQKKIDEEENENENEEGKSKQSGAEEGRDIPDPNSNYELGPKDTGVDESEGGPEKFGMWKGVVLRVLLASWGVILFLRLGFIVGNTGLWQGYVIVLTSAFISVLTIISVSAVATNGIVEGGGVYFLISRSLGAEFGGSIGVLFSVANWVGIGLYVVGFAEALRDLLITAAGSSWSLQVLGVITAMALLCIVMLGTGFEAKIQVGLFAILVATFVSFFAGAFRTWSWDNVAESWGPQYRDEESFVTIFSLFFPTTTGIMAGVSISGDLAVPERAIPLGTTIAIGISTAVYLLVMTFIAAASPRAVLYENFLIMEDLSLFGWLLFAGLFAATVSSALGNLIGGPRVFQAVCKDGIYKGKFWEFFSVVTSSGDPLRGYFLAIGVALIAVAAGDINAIAPLISNFFLLTFSLINYAVWAASASSSPGWRPGFKYYHPLLSLAASVVCVAAMFLISWPMSLITLGVAALLYKYIELAKVDINWGSAGQARAYQYTLNSALRLEGVADHVKNFRPQVLLLVDKIDLKDPMLAVANDLTADRGLFVVGQVQVGDFRSHREDIRAARMSNALYENGMKAFTTSVTAEDLRSGARALIQTAGLGRLKPNIVMMGFLKNWNTANSQAVGDYTGVIQDVFDLDLSLVIGRNISFLDTDYRPKGTIDVYWLTDDGGLTLLLPYLLNQDPFWCDAKLRLMAVADPDQYDATRERTERLLRRFRVEAEVVCVKRPPPEPAQFEIDEYCETTGANYNGTDDPARAFIRLGSMIRHHSEAASLIVVSMPVPRSGDNRRGYLSRLATLTSDSLPTLLIRGNQENVITYFS